MCQNAFREDQILAMAIQLEKLIQDPHISQIKTEAINNLRHSINEKIDNWETIKHTLQQSELRKLKRKLRELEYFINTKQTSQDTNPKLFWAELIEDPTLIKANKPYNLILPNAHTEISVIFNSTLVSIFFNPTTLHDLRIAKKFLRAISNGYTNGDSTGIRILRRNKSHKSNMNHNQIFEIKTIGKTTGHIRLGGFIENGNLYIVHHSFNGDHSKIRTSFISILLEKKKRFYRTTNTLY